MIIGTAQAATTGGATEPFWHSPTFWVAVSFVILVALLFKPVWRFTTKTLDEKIAEIQSRIEEATQLREEAQNLLAATKRKLTEAEKEGADIIAAAREEAQVLRQRMTTDIVGGTNHDYRAAMVGAVRTNKQHERWQGQCCCEGAKSVRVAPRVYMHIPSQCALRF